MSYKYGTNGNDLNWDAVIFLNEVCQECAIQEYELREELKEVVKQYSYDWENHEDYINDLVYDIIESWECTGHTKIYYPGHALDINLLLEGGKKINDVTPWHIAHDTNSNFVDLVGPVPDDYLTDDYIRDRNT